MQCFFFFFIIICSVCLQLYYATSIYGSGLANEWDRYKCKKFTTNMAQDKYFSLEKKN